MILLLTRFPKENDEDSLEGQNGGYQKNPCRGYPHQLHRILA